MLKAIHGFRHVLSLALLGLVGLLLAGCGGGGGSGDNDSAFAAAPQVSFVVTNAALNPTGTAQIAVVLDRPAPRSFSLNLVVTGDVSQFSVPSSVRVSDKQTSVVFPVSASGAVVGSTISVQMAAGSGYRVGGPASVVVTVGTDDLAEVRLVGGNATLSPGSSADYALVLDQPSPIPLTVNLIAVGDTGQFFLPGAVNIAAGQLAANFSVTASASAPLGASVQFSVLGGLNYAVGTPAGATVNVGAGLAPEVRLVGGNTTLSPGASTNYSLILNQPAPSATTVRFAVVGNSGQFSVPESVSIPAGQSSAGFSVSASPTVPLGASVQFSIVAGSGYRIGTPSSATVTAGAGILPQVSLVGGNTTLSAGTSTNYSLVLNQPAPSATTVRLAVVGNSDQFLVPESVSILAGQSSVSFAVAASPTVPLGASVQFSIVAGTGYTIGTPASATVTAGAGLAPQVRLIGGDTTLAPGGSTTYGLLLDQPASGVIQVNLARVGDIDLFDVPATVDIPAGQSSANFEVTAGPDAAGGQIQILIVPSSAYTVGEPASATVSGGPAVGPVVPVNSVILLSSSPQLPSVGTPPVTLTAFVRDANNALMEGVPVTFSADNDGTLLVTRAITDESGTAQAELNTLASKANRVITATATAGGRSDSVEVRVVDTTISISGRNSGLIGDSITLTLTLRDSAGNPIAGAPLTVAFPGGNILTSATPTTDGSGRATVTLGLIAAGEHEVSVAGFGATVTFTITVSPYSLRFVQPEPLPAERTEYTLNQLSSVQVELEIDGVNAADGTQIRFVTTRGAFTGANPASTAGGLADIEIESSTSGPAIITAVVESGVSTGTRAEIEVLFVAERARSMTLQANPAVIGTNRQGETDEQSEIVAVLRDPIGNLVKGKTINFNLTDVTGGSLSPASAVTDVFGRATTTYTAGSTASAQNGIEVRAEVLNPDPADPGFELEESVQLTTSQKALFITLGTGDTIVKDEVRYFKPYGVLVTDSTGSPVANANVTIEIWPTFYHKGFWERPPLSPWVQIETLDPVLWPNGCINEDANRDGVLDLGEDFNENGILDPGTVVTLSAGSLVTDATGFADFEIVYFQNFARWVDVELTARAVVAGGESTEQVFFRLPIAAADISSASGPAGNPSPFGISNTCAANEVAIVTPQDAQLPNATVGDALVPIQFEAAGGAPPYSWTALGLPPGLALSPAGLLNGTPSQAGDYDFLVIVFDSESGGISRQFSITVDP